MGRGPTEPQAGRSTFLLSSGGAGVAGITEWPVIWDRLRLRSSFRARREWHVCPPPPPRYVLDWLYAVGGGGLPPPPLPPPHSSPSNV